MLFNSLAFLVFFPVVAIIYWIMPHKFRNFWLLAASCFFYMYAIPVYILVLAAMICFDYFAAQWIVKSSHRTRKAALIASISGNALLLFIFKYYNFFIEQLDFTLNFLHLENHLPYSHWLLPIGLAFHTLQSIAYIIDVYRRTIQPERNLVNFALFVMFFPQMVAGPIERGANMLPQFRRKHALQLQNIVEGFRLILWGFFQKVVIADRLGLVVDKVYENPGAHSTSELLLASIFLLLQVYCDFCGYSDIARGSAKVMGIELTLNFNNPLAAVNMMDFWRRWHITLMSWIRSYLFYPMMRSSWFGRWIYFNVLVMFVFSGLWHGAQGTFIVWGLLNGIFFLFERKIPFLTDKKHPYLKISLNILLISLICVFFRANSMGQAKEFFGQMAGGFQGSFHWAGVLERLQISGIDLMIDLLLAGFIIGIQIAMNRRGMSYAEIVYIPDRISPWAKWTLYYALIFGILLLGVFTGSPFVYFQF